MRTVQLLTIFGGFWTLIMVHLASRLLRMDAKRDGLSETVYNDRLHPERWFNPDDCAPCTCPVSLRRHYVSGGVPVEYGKTRHELCIWPRLNESRDRILPQMDLDRSTDELYWIYAPGLAAAKAANESYANGDCPVNNCRVSRSNIAKADLILLHDFDLSLFQTIRRLKGLEPPGGYPKRLSAESPIVVWHMLESPSNRGDFSYLNDIINWTATYRRDSVISTPYERFTFYKHFSGRLPAPERNFAANKTKKAAAFISNCRGSNGRLDYARELGRYIDVDVYGSCGPLNCPRNRIEPDPCYEKLRNEYKFYLAFENSNCRHYITEKFFWNALLNDVIPIVMGAPPEDYDMIAPPGSYIHVDHFETPKHLATYLHRLDLNDDLYNEYFRWKGSGSYINTKFWCRLCSLLNESKLTGAKVWYSNLHKWWQGAGVCIQRGNKTWASWNDNPRQYGYVDTDTLHVELET